MTIKAQYLGVKAQYLGVEYFISIIPFVVETITCALSEVKGIPKILR